MDVNNINLIELDELTKKGLRIGIFPIIAKDKHYFTAGVRIGNNKKMTWIKGNEGCPFSSFENYSEAFTNIIAYCNNI